MKFHKEGIPSLIIVLLFSAILIGLALFLNNYWIKILAYLLSGFLIIVILQFFRSPIRKWKKDAVNDIIAPADGKVVVIEETIETEYFQDKRLQVSIFMSPINVHVNRYPIAGQVTYAKYHPGQYLVAWHPKASTENERTTIVVKNAKTEILFRQIAGALARRIVMYAKEKQEVEQTEECGFIKFGSRVDLYFPIGTQLNVNIGDNVKGGITSIASI